MGLSIFTKQPYCYKLAQGGWDLSIFTKQPYSYKLVHRGGDFSDTVQKKENADD